MTGLNSVTFRSLSPAEVVRLAAEAGLDGIEWGGDVHVPPGEPSLARSVGRATRDAGLRVFSYGSYYRLCSGQRPERAFSAVLETAQALGAPNVRVWAGDRAPAEATDDYFAAAGDELARLADLAAGYGLTVSLEYHRWTLTQTPGGTLRLLEAAGAGNLFTYWQPNPDLSRAENCAELTAVLPRLSHLHVFHWDARGRRLPLAQGEADWRAYLGALDAAARGRALLLEFVADDAPEQLRRDAAALKRWEVTL